jgi:hypothetical protein
MRGFSRSRGLEARGIQQLLGTFDTPEEASAVYEQAARDLHEEFYRPS